MMLYQLTDSTIPTTRRYWRREIAGLASIADDPRLLREIPLDDVAEGERATFRYIRTGQDVLRSQGWL